MSVPIAKPFVILAGGNSTVGPSAGGSTDNAVARWDGTTGRVLQNSTVIISDTGNITFGTAGSILSGTTGSQGITVTGTNQDFSITPSGSGVVAMGGNIQLSGGGNYQLAGSAGFLQIRAGSGVVTAFYFANTEKARFAATTGNLLLGGLTTDGTGVLQFPAATTSAGGITFGADWTLYRTGAGQMASNAATWIFDVGATATLQAGNNQPLVLSAPGTNASGVTIKAGSTGSVTIQTNGSTTAFTLDSSQNATFAKLITSYNGISTTGNGVSTVQASGRATAQVAANASVSTYTVGASDASFRISANVLVTTATTHSFSMTCAYTDEGNVARTLTLGFTQLSGATLVTLITNVTGAGPYESLQYHIRCKANTAITFATTGTFTTVTYNAEGVITKVA